MSGIKYTFFFQTYFVHMQQICDIQSIDKTSCEFNMKLTQSHISFINTSFNNWIASDRKW